MEPISNGNCSGAGSSSCNNNSSSDGRVEQPSVERGGMQNHLRRKKNKLWTPAERAKVFTLFKSLGKDYEAIAKEMPGRTPIAIRDHLRNYHNELFLSVETITAREKRQKQDNDPDSSECVLEDKTNKAKKGPTHVPHSTSLPNPLQIPIEANVDNAFKDENCDRTDSTVSDGRTESGQPGRPLLEDNRVGAGKHAESSILCVNSDLTEVVRNFKGQGISQLRLILEQRGSSSRETPQHPSPMSLSPATALPVESASGRNRVHWTEKERNLARKLRAQRISYVDIAKKLGRTPASVGYHFRRLDRIAQSRCAEPNDLKQHYKRWTEEEKETARALKAQGIPTSIIAKKLGRTFDAVREHFQNSKDLAQSHPGVPGSGQKPSEERRVEQNKSQQNNECTSWTVEEQELPKEFQARGIHYEVIAERLGRTPDLIWRYLRDFDRIVQRRKITIASERQQQADDPVFPASPVTRDTTNVTKEEPSHVYQSTPSTDFSQAAMQANANYVIKNDHCDQIRRTAYPAKTEIEDMRWPPQNNHTIKAEEYTESLKPHVNNDPTQVVWNFNGQSTSQPPLISQQQGSSLGETLQHPSSMSNAPDMKLAVEVDSSSYLADNETAHQGNVGDAPTETVIAERLPNLPERMKDSETAGDEFLDLADDFNWDMDETTFLQVDRLLHGSQ